MNGSSCSSGPREGTAGPCHGTASSMIYHGPSVSGMGGLERGHPGTRRGAEDATHEGGGVDGNARGAGAVVVSQRGRRAKRTGVRTCGFLETQRDLRLLVQAEGIRRLLALLRNRRGRDRAPGGIRGARGGRGRRGARGTRRRGIARHSGRARGRGGGRIPHSRPGSARAGDRLASRFQRDHARETQQAFGTVPAREFDTAPRVRAGRSRAVPPTGRAGLRTTPETCALALTARSRRPAGRHVRARSTFAEAPVPAVASSENEVACRASGSFIPFPESQTVETSSPGGAVWHLFVFHPDVPGVIFCPSPIET